MESKPKTTFTEAIYKYYNTKKILFAALSGVVFIICSIFTGYHTVGLYEDLVWKLFYYFVVALQNISITLFSIFILDFMINSQYKKQLDEDVAKILASPELTKNFIKEERNQEILESSMNAILGERISKKIQETIIYNYQVTDRNSLRENVYVDIELSGDQKYPGFFVSKFTFEFDIVGIEGKNQFKIYYAKSKEEYRNYVNELTGINRILTFPFLAAKGSENEPDSFKMISFKVEDREITSDEKDGVYTYPVDFSETPRTHIRFQFQTLLNRTENYLFEDIGCVCDRYHIDFGYDGTDIESCNWYSSYNGKAMRSRENERSKHIDLDDVLLPGTFFIFIWNYTLLEGPNDHSGVPGGYKK
ncbi:MAG: hypothetical protein HFI68_02395 [Lachnospiraceae bacterium]|nr:hypothetical protein [Lachnospiraceae bacterium]